MKAACCDWAIVHQGRPAGPATRARSCPRHLRGRTRHLRPDVPWRWPRQRRAITAGLISATWAAWLIRAEASGR